MRIFVRGVILLVGLMVLAGCAPAQTPTAAPVPTPSVPVCTPLDGSTPFPCTQADFESLAEQRKLYQEAEGVLARFYAEHERQEVDWRLREFTPEFEATTTGEFRDFAKRLIELDRQDEARRVGEPAPMVGLRPVMGQSKSGSVATLRACVDGAMTRYVTRSAPEPQPGVTLDYHFYFSRQGQDLKISTSTVERVETC